MPDNDGISERIDQLAGVVMYVLVDASPKALTVEQVCRRAERKPKNADERAEVEAALRVLMADKLARREGDKWIATRAAVRADELAF
jgi:hypothetical protein